MFAKLPETLKLQRILNIFLTRLCRSIPSQNFLFCPDYETETQKSNSQLRSRERGLVAEGARFLLMTLDVNLDVMLAAGREANICSFDYFRLIDPDHPHYSRLASLTSDYPRRGEGCE